MMGKDRKSLPPNSCLQKIRSDENQGITKICYVDIRVIRNVVNF